jgi:hypothetical protein
MRHRPPPRRMAIAEDLAFEGRHYRLCVGLLPDGKVAEIFVDGTRNAEEAILDDACILASVIRQHGVEWADIHASLGKLSVDMTPTDRPASPIGLIVQRAMEIEREIAGEGR